MDLNIVKSVRKEVEIMRDLDLYDYIVDCIYEYFEDRNVEDLFLHGGCYWFASYLHERLKHSFLMFNKEKEHCAIEIQNKLYDITGCIKSTNYVLASNRQLKYMAKNYTPNFDQYKLEKYLDHMLSCVERKLG